MSEQLLLDSTDDTNFTESFEPKGEKSSEASDYQDVPDFVNNVNQEIDEGFEFVENNIINKYMPEYLQESTDTHFSSLLCDTMVETFSKEEGNLDESKKTDESSLINNHPGRSSKNGEKNMDGLNLPQCGKISTAVEQTLSPKTSRMIQAHIYTDCTLKETVSNQTSLCERESQNHGGLQFPMNYDKAAASSSKKLGILADNMYAKGIVKNLLENGHRLFIWVANSKLGADIKKTATQNRGNCKICFTQSEVVRRSDIILNCLASRDEVKKTMDTLGIMDDHDDFIHGKGYIEMTNVDSKAAIHWRDLIHKKGATYLQATVDGTVTDATDGKLLTLLAGDESLFADCSSIFNSIGKVVFLQEFELASKIYTILQSLRGVFLAALAEGYAFVDRVDNISVEEFHNIFKSTSMCNEYFLNKGTMMLKKKFDELNEPSLQQFHEDLAKVLEMAEKCSFPMPLAACLNQIYKQTRRLGYDFENQDPVSVFTRFRY